jgi:hypothetical protein
MSYGSREECSCKKRRDYEEEEIVFDIEGNYYFICDNCKGYIKLK